MIDYGKLLVAIRMGFRYSLRMKSDKLMSALRQEIMICVRANDLPVTFEFFLMLIARSESELREIAQDLHIRIPNA